MAASNASSERVKKYRQRAKEAGLVRVDVLVPKGKVDALKIYAAQLSDDSNAERLKEVRQHIRKAYKKYRASCLDNIDIDPDEAQFADAAVISAALIHRGKAEAFKLGRQIRELIS